MKTISKAKLKQVHKQIQSLAKEQQKIFESFLKEIEVDLDSEDADVIFDSLFNEDYKEK